MIEIRGVADIVVKKISSVLQFTASDGFKTSFDVLSTAECNNIQCLFEFINKKYRSDIAPWIEARLKILTRFIKDDAVIIPLCLANYDEIVKRLLLGILYVLRNRIGVPIVLDDMLSFITNELYSEAFVAMMRPYIVSINRELDSKEILMYNPVIFTPGGHGGVYRISHPTKYVVLFDGERWTLPRKEVEKIAYS